MSRKRAAAMRRPGLAWRRPVLWLWGFTVLTCSWVYSQETTNLHQQGLRRSHLPSSSVVYSSGHGFPWFNLRDPVELNWLDAEKAEQSQAWQESLESLTLAAGDFDEDGVLDLICGFGATQ